MKITHIQTTAVSIPRATIMKTSFGQREHANTVVVEMHTDDGLIGIGQSSVGAPYYGESAAGMVTNITHHLAPVLLGEDPRDIDRLNERLRATLYRHWSSMAALELALWDLKGQALGVPVYQLLGGRLRPGVSLLGFLNHDSPERMASAAEAMLNEQPYPVLKMKIGLDPKEDLERFSAVAEAIRGRAVLQVDGNCGYTMAQAIPTLHAMEATGALGAVEQPVARLEDLADLARRLHVPVIADEAIFPPEDVLSVIEQRAASVVLLKLTKHGGITHSRRIATACHLAGIQLSTALYFDLIAVAAAHVSAALPGVTWPAPLTPLVDTVLSEPVQPDGLLLRPPEGPGWGVTLDRDKLEKYAVKFSG